MEYDPESAMFCRVCLNKNMQVYYKLNITYVNLMETVTEVKIKVNDVVCSFCLTTMKKIQKFTDKVKEANSILMLSSKIEEDDNDVNTFYSLGFAPTRNDSIDSSRSLCDTYGSNIGDEPVKVEYELLEIDEIKEEPQVSSDIMFTNDSGSDVPLTNTAGNKAQLIKFTESRSFLPEKKWKNSRKDKTKLIPNQTGEDAIQNATQTIKNKFMPHESPRGKPFLCNDCPKKFARKCYLLNHSKIHLREKAYTCNICPHKFGKNYDLERHLKTHSGSVLYEKIWKNSRKDVTKLIPNQTGEDAIQNVTQTIKNKFMPHESPHGEPFLCKVCPKKFDRKRYFISHLTTHLREKAYTCNICSLKFRKNYDLERHLITHSGEKPYSCNTCSSKFSWSCTLKRHLKTHTGEIPYTCNVMENSSLSRHIKTLNTNEKPFCCNICSFKCKLVYDLTKHIEIHSSGKPFPCDLCTFRYNTSNELQNHIKLKHNQ